ncbi:hypothetical protein V6N11_075467 [Hibiscus sabdariffa]|uniref:EXS domain-containing protein n=1 Tax=Hibiscus sabdariffa TaxID=183260 RepID=A0ABR2R6L0_9ROSI
MSSNNSSKSNSFGNGRAGFPFMFHGRAYSPPILVFMIKSFESAFELMNSVDRNGSRSYETIFLLSSEEGGEYELVYFRRLDDEFNKVDRFYKAIMQEVMKEADVLNKQMEALIAFRIKVENPPEIHFDRSVEMTRLASDIAGASAAALSAFSPSGAKSASQRAPHVEAIEESTTMAMRKRETPRLKKPNQKTPKPSLFGFIVLHMLMYAIIIFYWRKYRVNYAFIFGFKPGTELVYRQVLLLSFGLGALALASVLSNLDMEMDPKTKEYEEITELIPLMLVVYLFIILFMPFNILYRSSRFILLTCLFHCICAPLYKVTLPDFFLADQLTSQLETVLDFKFQLHPQTLTTIVASLEIIRRGVWNFFRLENEHLNNVGKYRAFKSLPLPFNYDEDDDKDD